MIRLLLAALLAAASLLCVLPVPTQYLWPLAVAVGAFPVVTVPLTGALLAWVLRRRAYRVPVTVLAAGALILFCRPVWSARRIASGLDARLAAAFGPGTRSVSGPHRAHPFSLAQLVAGIGAPARPARTYRYAPGGPEHDLRFYPPAGAGPRPCLVVVHGGSWKSGNNSELSNTDDYFARAGYAVASINYRLAPAAHSPAPQEDVHLAFAWLRAHAAALRIDTNAFVLLGRSAGGQIVLTAAYTLNEPGLRGVISFYGPTDMIMGWNEPHNQAVIRHQEVLRDFFGGSPAERRQAYLDGSPALHVTPRTVPTLLVHGMLDAHVHYRESAVLDSTLQAVGVPHLLLGLPWATHGCEYSLNGPSGQLAVYAEERFLQAVTGKH